MAVPKTLTVRKRYNQVIDYVVEIQTKQIH